MARTIITRKGRLPVTNEPDNRHSHDDADEPLALADKLDDALRTGGLAAVLVLATTAMTGSLYFSEVKHYLPCILCWYQRGLMYPMVAVAAVAILRRAPRAALLTLAMSLAGMAVATYHYLLEKTDWFDAFETCKGGVPCTTPWINALGFITIPCLSLTAFTLVALASLSAWRRRDEMIESWHDPSATSIMRVVALLVAGIVLGIVVAIVFSHPALQPHYN